MYWNHRVMRAKELGEEILRVVEVYYDEHSGNIIGWTEQEAVWGKDLDGLRQCLTWMAEALDAPVLDEAELLQRAEEIEAMGADFHETGLSELGQWADDGGTP